MPTALQNKLPCPCSHNFDIKYQNCCGPYHLGQVAPDPLTLMRSRYSAYVLKLEDYLLKTWHRSTRPSDSLFGKDDLASWQSLEIKQHSIAPDGLSGMVEFVAIYKINGKAHRLHEKSRFVFENNQWYYLDGTFD